MELEEVYKNLCFKDKRNPTWQDLYGQDEECEIPEPRNDCYCDNCFYGRDKLALEIIKLNNA